MNFETKQCQNCKNSFEVEAQDFAFYKKINVPPPTFCPECRLQRRLMFRNERNYYRRICDLCKRNIIAIYPQDVGHPVYCVKCWWSDKWDPLEYGRDFDFSRSFSEQFLELRKTVPEIAIMNDDSVTSTNSEYSYDFFFSKNCYLMVCGWYVDNAAYSYHVDHAKDIFDCTHVDASEMMYECIGCYKDFGCKYCNLVFDSRNCTFGRDLRGCSDCFMCVGLRNKKYCIKNKQYTQEEYKEEMKKKDLENRDSIRMFQEEFDAFALKYPQKHSYILKSTNSTGHWVLNSKNARSCFYTRNSIDSGFMLVHDKGEQSYDCNNTGKSTLNYNSVTPDQSYGCIATMFCTECRDVSYSMHYQGSENCFGCSGLKKGVFTILNKKYSKLEYERLREKIVEHMKKTGEWGEFFDPSVAMFAYNETAAHEWFQLTQEEVLKRGWKWKIPEKKEYEVTLAPNDVPGKISSINNTIAKEIIGCLHEGKCNEKCTTAFKVTAQELQFYKKFNIPLPQLCPNCRHYQRIKRRNPPKLWHRKCQCAGIGSENSVYKNIESHQPHGADHCPNEFETSYVPERKEIVYCEACYNAEVV